ncbi:hypothetical protein F0L74_13245 [Chitinophaga agrisoli]|uniref:Uncharacterized protein n=1 Tax=Chitinophaga agrisoli TaxID=2607653 RepID=A0A5B2VWK2_9BACT|nr:hypothetical protein [Chitinophaga agrisoli]KAA2243455.1 hypothetical protein F0L74_13245 [Chitinophaga agrisoli]
MDNWRLAARRITKYDPRLRSANGAFLENDWTSFHDIGKTFKDGVLTEDTYLKVESQYIAAALLLLREVGCSRVCTNNVEKPYSEGEVPVDYLSLYKELHDGMILDVDKLPPLMTLILREYAWCELFWDDNCAIRFGYDYYMYSNGLDILGNEQLKRQIEDLGLFVE